MNILKAEKQAGAEEKEELLRLKKKAETLLIENNLTSSGAESLKGFIDRYRLSELTSDAQHHDPIGLAYGLGEILAESVIDKYKWTYSFLEFENGSKGLAVVSPDKKFCIFVHHYIYNLLNNKEMTNNILLLFNMLTPDSLKDAAGDDYTVLH